MAARSAKPRCAAAYSARPSGVSTRPGGRPLGDFGHTVRHVDLADAAHAAVLLPDLPAAIRPYASGHEAHAHSAAGRALYTLTRSGRPKAARLAVERLEAAIVAFGPERAQAIASCEKRLAALPG